MAAARQLPQSTPHDTHIRPASGQMTAPLPWFLPGAIRIRGGLARHFASAWLFHRGIHLESTLAELELKVTQFQTVGVHDRWRIGGFYYFSQESTLAKIQPV